MTKPQSRTVVMAVDNSAASVGAIKWATKSFLRPETDHLHILHVVAPTCKQTFVVGDHAVMLAEPAGPSSADMDLADKVLAQCRAMAEEAGIRNVTTTRMCGVLGRSSEVGNAVSHYAVSHNADALVVGSRGLGSTARSLLGLVGLGSVSDYLVRHATVPVVVHKSQGCTR